MSQRKLQSMNSCLIYCYGALLSQLKVSLPRWRTVIELFLSCNIGKCLIFGLRCYLISNLKFVLFFALLLLCHGDQKIPVPRPKNSGNCQPLTFCHRNLNNIWSENCFKVSLLKSFNALRNRGFICLPKRSYLLQWTLRLIFLIILMAII